MIHYESSIMRHSLCYTFSSKLSHFWGHISLYFGDVVKGFMVGVLPFFGWDLLKVFLVVRIAKKIGRYQNRVTEQVIAQQNGFYRESAD